MKSQGGLFKSFHSSIVLRSAALVLIISGIVGYALLGVITRYVEPTIEKSLNDRIVELVKTVENTARIACFLGDPSLAGEVAKGLLMNRDVERVVIANDQGTLADVNRSSLNQLDAKPGAMPGKGANANPHTIPNGAPAVKPLSSETYPEGATIRALTSPFKADALVGKIVVVRNQASIDEQVAEATNFIRLLIILQTTAIIIVVTAIAVGYIAHPIHQISKRLNELSAVDGEKLEAPRGHGENEIGRLVRDVNALIDKLVRGLFTERQLRVERELEEKRFRAIFENAETGIFVIDRQGFLKSFNPAFRRTMCLEDSVPPAADTTGAISLLDNLGEQAERVRSLIDKCLAEKHTRTEELMLIDSNGSPRWVNMILNPVEDELMQGVINDITENKIREAHANKLALTDALTGLGNRLGFDRHIENLINDRKINAERNFTLMLIDLDRFKQVNDTHGHDVGDAVLVHVARHIEQSIRKADFAARLGGDEFVVLLPFVTDKGIIARLANALINNISQPLVTQSGMQTCVGASIGVSLVNRPDMKKEEIIKEADLALYAVKDAGRNGFRIFGAEETDQAPPRPNAA